jgi:putative membrane protein insertion efficiency factor
MKKLILSSIRLYQRYLNFEGVLFRQLFLTDKACRFNPTCSEYLYCAIDKYGTVKGLFLGFKRIIRCHPWNQGGFDPVP